MRLSLHLELMDERLMHGAIAKPRDSNHYLAWSNGLTRTLARLGIKGAEAHPAETLGDIATEIAHSKSGAAA